MIKVETDKTPEELIKCSDVTSYEFFFQPFFAFNSTNCFSNACFNV